MVEVGLKGRQELTVTEQLTAHALDSELATVFSTPMMIALIERTCFKSLLPHLAEGEGTVGTKVDVAHMAATPVGAKVWCESEVIEVEKRRLLFRVEVFDDGGKVGEGTHERFIIKSEGFEDKAKKRVSG